MTTTTPNPHILLRASINTIRSINYAASPSKRKYYLTAHLAPYELLYLTSKPT